MAGQALALADRLGDVVEGQGEVATDLTVDVDGADHPLEVLARHAGGEGVEGVARVAADADLQQHPAELAAGRLFGFLGDVVERGQQAVAGLQAAGEQLEVVGQELGELGPAAGGPAIEDGLGDERHEHDRRQQAQFPNNVSARKAPIVVALRTSTMNSPGRSEIPAASRAVATDRDRPLRSRKRSTPADSALLELGHAGASGACVGQAEAGADLSTSTVAEEEHRGDEQECDEECSRANAGGRCSNPRAPRVGAGGEGRRRGRRRRRRRRHGRRWCGRRRRVVAGVVVAGAAVGTGAAAGSSTVVVSASTPSAVFTRTVSSTGPGPAARVRDPVLVGDGAGRCRYSSLSAVGSFAEDTMPPPAAASWSRVGRSLRSSRAR